MGSMKIDTEKLSELIKERMRERKITVSKVAADLQWPRSMAAIIIQGQRSVPEKRLIELQEYFDIGDDEVPLYEKDEPKSKGNKIFISYSHKDKPYLDRLMVHLRPLEKQGKIDPWVDTRLLAGDKWKKEIEAALKDARVAVLLLSADFLASDFIIENELPPLLQAAEGKGTTIIPVIVKPCRFLREKNLCEFQTVNPPDEPLSLTDENERELVYDTIAQRIEDLFD